MQLWKYIEDSTFEFDIAQLLFQCTKDYPDLHSTPYLVEAIIKAVEKNIPGMGNYLDARLRSYNGIPDTQPSLSGNKSEYIDPIKIRESSLRWNPKP